MHASHACFSSCQSWTAEVLSCSNDCNADIQVQLDCENGVEQHTIWSEDEVPGNGLQQYLDAEGRCEDVVGHNDLQAAMHSLRQGVAGTNQYNRSEQA